MAARLAWLQRTLCREIPELKGQACCGSPTHVSSTYPRGRPIFLCLWTASTGCLSLKSVGTSPTAALANTSSEKAIATRKTPRYCTPTGAGRRHAGYRWPEWIRLEEEAGIIRSRRKKGCSPDNAPLARAHVGNSHAVLRARLERSELRTSS